MSNTYQHVFFDLDHTLWDYEKNANETLIELYTFYSLANYGIECSSFLERCADNNRKVWDLYREDKINRETLRTKRFEDTFLDLKIPLEKFPKELPNHFLESCPTHTHLIEGAKEVLTYLQQKNYSIHLITNGFEETQLRKLANCKIDHYFSEIITSDRCNAKKPEPQIFEFALNISKAKSSESIMIGDEFEFDIIGAKKVGIHQIYFNPENKPDFEIPTFTISLLAEINTIL